jgi:hypothetical protein
MERDAYNVGLSDESTVQAELSHKQKRRFGYAFPEVLQELDEPATRSHTMPPGAKPKTTSYTNNTLFSFKSTRPCLDSVPLDTLCRRCRSLKFNTFSNMTITNFRGEALHENLGTVEELRDSACPLCNLFHSMAPSDPYANSQARSHQQCHLRAFSANYAFARLDNRIIRSLQDGILLAVLRADPREISLNTSGTYTELTQSVQETGYLSLWPMSRPAPHFGARTIDPARCDFDFMINCLQYCQTNHHKSCHINSKTKRALKAWKVIDCKTKEIVEAPPDLDYIALSYVWGMGTSNDTSQDINNAPRVIRDAMDVTLKLSFRYLWVDRYCIDYADKAETAAQILQMDLIYSQATLTIVAAAGDNPNDGLPGISVRHRTPQPSIRVRDMLLVSTFPHPSWTVGKTKWASRGWTYQEQVLSKRLMVFTDCQVLYECEGMHCAESRVLPLDVMHCSSGTRLKTKVPRGAFVDRQLGQDPLSIISCISEFKTRQLTMSTDNLHALEGIFQVFSRAKKPVHTLMGIPMSGYRRAGPKSSKMTKRTSEQSFITGLSWYHSCIAERLECFPSWTWAGWEGPINSSLLLEKSGNEHKYAHILLIGQDGTHTEMSNIQQPGHDSASQAYSNTVSLDIRAWTFEIPKTAFFLSQKNEYRVGILTRFEGLIFVPFYPDRDLDFLPKRSEYESRIPITNFNPTDAEGNLTAVILAGRSGEKEAQEESETFALVVEQRNGYSERVGCFVISKKVSFRYRGSDRPLFNIPLALHRVPKRRQAIRIR